jgi:nicotinate phosphoribosyltransferase
MAHENEEEAFGRFLDLFPRHSVLLVDTYDVHNAVEKIIAMGRKPRGVRLDSGDLVADSIWTRKRFDDTGWGDVEIFVSGDLDEDRITSLLAAGARIDTFGVGTSLSTSSDAPSLNVLYKLAEVERDGVVWEAAKLSAAKVTYPGRKQVYRATDAAGQYAGDVIALEDEPALPGAPLLVPMMREGKRIAPAQTLKESQALCREQVGRLPVSLRELSPAAAPYPVGHSARLEKLLLRVRERIARMSPV